MIPVDDQTYTYEQQTGGSIGNNNNQSQSSAAISAAELIKRDNNSTERDVPLQDQSAPTTVYVSQSNDDNDALRYTTNAHQVRYDEETYHQRYEYQQPSHSHTNSDEIKVELVRNHNQHQAQSKVHIYEHDGGQRTEVNFFASSLILYEIVINLNIYYLLLIGSSW